MCILPVREVVRKVKRQRCHSLVHTPFPWNRYVELMRTDNKQIIIDCFAIMLMSTFDMSASRVCVRFSLPTYASDRRTCHETDHEQCSNEEVIRFIDLSQIPNPMSIQKLMINFPATSERRIKYAFREIRNRTAVHYPNAMVKKVFERICNFLYKSDLS